jgi:hypothetical protein
MEISNLEDELVNNAKTELENICNMTRMITSDINILSSSVKENKDKIDIFFDLEDTKIKCDDIKIEIQKFIEITNTISFMSEVCRSDRSKKAADVCLLNVAKLKNWSDNIEFKMIEIENYCKIEE